MGYLFAPECNHVEESHSGQRFVKIRQRDVTTSPLYNQSLSYGYVLRNPIGHFRVPNNLTFKARLSAKPLI